MSPAAWLGLLLAIEPAPAEEPPEPVDPRPAVVFYSGVPQDLGQGTVSSALYRTFGETLREAAAPIYVERRWRAVGFDPKSPPMVCDLASCFAAARIAGASTFVRTLLLADAPGCRLRVERHRVEGRALVRHLERRLERCGLDAIAVAARDLGRALATGPRFGWAPTEDLTPVTLAELYVPSIPDVTLRSVRTSSLARERPLADALQRWSQSAITVFDDEEGRARFALRGHLLDECDLRRVVGQRPTPEQTAFCDGNHWAWLLVGVPVGGLLAWASSPEMDRGSIGGFAGVSVGVLGAVTTGVLGLTLMRQGHGPESAEYHSRPETLRALAEDYNAKLRSKLDLSVLETETLAPRP